MEAQRKRFVPKSRSWRAFLLAAALLAAFLRPSPASAWWIFGRRHRRSEAKPVAQVSFPGIWALIEFQGDLWVGTLGDGLFRLPRQGAIHHFRAGASPLKDDRIRALAVYRGELWVGTLGGLQVFDGWTWRGQNPGRGRMGCALPHAIVPDGRHLWLATDGGGLWRWDRARWSPVTTGNGLPSNDVLGLVVGEDHDLWVATGLGLAHGRQGGRWRRVQPPGLPEGGELTALAARGNELWVGTRSHGLYHRGDDGWQRVTQPVLPHRHVTALLAASDGSLWVGTRAGLGRQAEDGTWQRFDQLPALRDSMVTQLVEYGGRIMAGTVDGRILSVGRHELRVVYSHGRRGG